MMPVKFTNHTGDDPAVAMRVEIHEMKSGQLWGDLRLPVEDGARWILVTAHGALDTYTKDREQALFFAIGAYCKHRQLDLRRQMA